jgi:Flp pilus assembly protein TadB
MTPGEALFCNFCGRSYGVKLCPHRHPNPRNAEVCSECGSRELSTPHPRMPFWLLPVVGLLSALPGLLLLTVTTLFIFALVQAVLSSQQLMFQAVMAGLMLAFLWYLYMHLPAFLRRFLSRLFRRSHRDDHDH